MSLVNAELQSRRDRNDARSKQLLLSKSEQPCIRFTNMNAEQLTALISNSSEGTIFVSFHTIAYFTLFKLIDNWKLDVNCIVVDTILARFAEWGYKTPHGTSLSLFLEKDAIKDVIHNRKSLFIMADVLFPSARNHAVWIYEKVQRYTVTWAELAVRHRLNVVALFIKDRGSHLEVFVDTVRSHENDPYDLVCEMFSTFERFLGPDTHLWENYPNVDLLGFPIRYPVEGDADALLPLAAFLGLSGFNTTRALRRLQASDALSKPAKP